MSFNYYTTGTPFSGTEPLTKKTISIIIPTNGIRERKIHAQCLPASLNRRTIIARVGKSEATENIILATHAVSVKINVNTIDITRPARK